MAWWNFWRRKRMTNAEIDALFGRVPDPSLKGAARADEWLNIVSGHGVKNRDKRTAAQFCCEPVTNEEARELWRGDDIVKKIIELLPKDMVREGYKIKSGKKDDAAIITDEIDTMGINRQFVKAKQFERAYGGSAIYPVLNDGSQSMAAPLREQSIQKVRFYQVFEPRELFPETWYRNPNDEKYGQPETWRVVPITGGGSVFTSTTVIHESRLVIFPGIRVSREPPNGVPWGWGDSVLTPVRAVLRDFHLSWSSVGALLVDIAQGVFKMKGLSEMLENNHDDIVEKRLQILDYSRSVMQSLAIDGDDDFTRQATPLSGIPDILIQFATRLAAAANMPVTKMMGISPAGLNATGESDSRNWYDEVGAEQETDRLLLERLIRFSMLSHDGPMNGQEPKVWSVEFNPLWTPSAKEDAETKYTIAQTDDLNIQNEIYSPEEAAASHYKGDRFNPDIVIDWKAREAQKKVAPSAVIEPDPAAPPPPGQPELGTQPGSVDKTAGSAKPEQTPKNGVPKNPPAEQAA